MVSRILLAGLTLVAAFPALDIRQAAPVSNTVSITNCVAPQTFALSFDDGPYSYGTNIAATLEKYKSKGSFYVNGDNWGCIYDHADILLARYKVGHMIGSHTHSDISTLTAAQFNDEITKVETALMKILGVKPRFFRPPYGTYTAANLKVLASRGYYTTLWSHASRDSLGATAAQSITSYRALYAGFPKPALSLAHETNQGTSTTVVPTVVPELLAKGYKLVTVAECLALSPYQVVGTPGVRDATWTCNAAAAAAASSSIAAASSAVALSSMSALAATTPVAGTSSVAVVPAITTSSSVAALPSPTTTTTTTPSSVAALPTTTTTTTTTPSSVAALPTTTTTTTTTPSGVVSLARSWETTNGPDARFAGIYDYADELIRRYQAGHQIASHTWSHPDISTLNAAQLNLQLDLVETALKKILDVVSRFFRPPYGAYNAANIAVLASRGYYTNLWSFDSGDSVGVTPANSVARYRAIYANFPAPVNALNHEVEAGTGTTIVPTVVPELLARGYRLVTVAECLGVSPYQSITAPSARDETWTCEGTPSG